MMTPISTVFRNKFIVMSSVSIGLFFLWLHYDALRDMIEYQFSSEAKQDALDSIDAVNTTAEWILGSLKELEKIQIQKSQLDKLVADVDYLYSEIDKISAVDVCIRQKRRKTVEILHKLAARLDELKADVLA
jgi:vacuolar-type H+-ATPase subunit I/STV1